MTEDDTQKRERNSGGDGKDQTSDKERDIEFGRVDLDIDRKVSKDILKLFMNNKLALDHDTQELHEAYFFDNPGARFGGRQVCHGSYKVPCRAPPTLTPWNTN